MKILHFILGKANPNRANGVNYVIHGLCKYACKKGIEVKVVGVSKSMLEPYQLVERENFNVEVYNKFFGQCFQQLKKYANEVDIVHLHSVWQNYNIIIANYLISINKPFVVTIHSGLTDDRIKQSNYYFKLLYHKLFQKRIFNAASGLQAITREEMSDISRMTSNKNIFFTPNGIDLDYHSNNIKISKSNPKTRFGYLGRVAKEKNIKSLILAISELPVEIQNNIECLLIGPKDSSAEKLIGLVNKMELTHCIKFVGEKYGDEKISLLKSFDFYIHPAYSDVVSIAVMEAMACGLPCVISRTAQVSYYYDSGAFLMMEPIISDIKRTILEMLNKRDSWEHMAENSEQLIRKLLNWDSATEILKIEYTKILELNS